jgi:cyclopropane fatty-acyl-phospholipid synthase-like methyltransferase
VSETYLSWKGWKEHDFGTFTREEARYFAKELQLSGLRSVAGLDVGEVGFGLGSFAGWVRHCGGRWRGIDTSPQLQKWAERAGFEIVDSAFSVTCGPQSFDLIAAFDVIEHMDMAAIRACFDDAARALRSGGLLVIRCPCGDSPFSGAVFRGDVTHQTLLGAGAIQQVAAEAGLQVKQVRAPALPVFGFGPMRAVRRMAVHGLRAATNLVIGRVLMATPHSVATPNMVAVLQKN